MSIFTDTMVEAIRKYRVMLRKHLPQAQRVNHSHRLGLKNPKLYTNEVMLYQLGYEIVEHLHQLDNTKQGYYSYSGVGQFAQHLKSFLDKYKLDEAEGRVMHASQLASRYLLQITQIMALGTEEQLTENLVQMQNCHEKILEGSSHEQLELYKSALENMLRKSRGDRPACYFDKLQQFADELEGEQRKIA